VDVIEIKKNWHKNQSYDHWDNICDWCIDQFGIPTPHEGRWYTQATVETMHFYFGKEDDASLFIMKWM
jgi:hypothetical protein